MAKQTAKVNKIKAARETKRFNKYGLDVVPLSLRPGEIKRFEVIGIGVDRSGQTRIPAATNVPPSDRIYDENGSAYDIASIKSIGVGDRETLNEIWFRKESAGQIILNGSIAAERELFEYLLLSNYNESNPNRDEGRQPIYRYIDPVKDASSALEKRKALKEAIMSVTNMTTADIKEFCLARGWGDKENIAVLRDKVEAYAMDHPEDFLLSSSFSNKTILATLNKAMQESIVKFDGRTYKFSWSETNELILQVPRTSDKMEAFASFVVGDDKGGKILEEIQRQLKKVIDVTD